MIKQLRSSAGVWISYKSTNIILDPGPGAIVRCNKVKPRLDPSSLDAIILTHKHLDHSGDVNVMIEAVTEGGFKKRGVLFAPRDSFGKDGVILSYLEGFLSEKIILKEGKYHIGDIDFVSPVRNIHAVETYGVKFYLGGEIVSFVSDTRYFEELAEAYRDSTILVLNVVLYRRRPGCDHLCLDEAVALVEKIKPSRAIFTHFGMSILRAKPHLLEKKIKEKNPSIKFAYDGFELNLPS